MFVNFSLTPTRSSPSAEVHCLAFKVGAQLQQPVQAGFDSVVYRVVRVAMISATHAQCKTGQQPTGGK